MTTLAATLAAGITSAHSESPFYPFSPGPNDGVFRNYSLDPVDLGNNYAEVPPVKRAPLETRELTAFRDSILVPYIRKIEGFAYQRRATGRDYVTYRLDVMKAFRERWNSKFRRICLIVMVGKSGLLEAKVAGDVTGDDAARSALYIARTVKLPEIPVSLSADSKIPLTFFTDEFPLIEEFAAKSLKLYGPEPSRAVEH